MKKIAIRVVKVVSLVGVGLVLATVALSQAPKPAKAEPVKACDAKVVRPSGITECEELRLATYQQQEQMLALEQKILELQGQVVQLQAQLLGAQQQTARAQSGKFVEDLRGGHPGTTFELPSQQFPTGRLVKTPAAAPEPNVPKVAPVPPLAGDPAKGVA